MLWASELSCTVLYPTLAPMSVDTESGPSLMAESMSMHGIGLPLETQRILMSCPNIHHLTVQQTVFLR